MRKSRALIDEIEAEFFDFFDHSAARPDQNPVKSSAKSSAKSAAKSAVKTAIKTAIDEALTDRQREFVEEYYFEGLTIYEISERHGVCPPSVSRTLGRARKNIFRVLRYAIGRGR